MNTWKLKDVSIIPLSSLSKKDREMMFQIIVENRVTLYAWELSLFVTYDEVVDHLPRDRAFETIVLCRLCDLVGIGRVSTGEFMPPFPHLGTNPWPPNKATE